MKFIYIPSKHRQSGTTMQKTGRIGGDARQRHARSVLPGFPAEPFQTLDDIERYTDGERIICLICGKPYKNVLIHTARIHAVDEEEYRNRFNIPARFSLVCTGTRDLLKVHARRPENLQHVRDRLRCKSKTGRRKRITTTFAKEAAKRALAKIAAENLHSRNETTCEWHLEQVRSEYAFRSIPVPAGELSWSGYKKRRKADTALQARHIEARNHWRANSRGSHNLDPAPTGED